MENLNLNMVLYISLMVFLISLAISIRIKNGIIFKIAIRFCCAVGFIFFINFISKQGNLSIDIPLNPITAGVIALFQIPGIALVYITKYAIYPM